MKKLTAFLLCITLFLGLAACGNSDTVQDDAPSAASSEQTPVPEPTPDPTPAPDQNAGKVLVAYFSATGNTAAVANSIAQATGGDLFELVPVEPYTSDDLDYNDDNSRVVYEHEHPEEQNIELTASTVDNWAEYDTAFIGYPIWWHAAAWPVNSFITENDFTGKTVIPFCTSASSGLEDSDTKLRDMAGTGDWLAGQRFSSSTSQDDVESWVSSLDLSAENTTAFAENGKSLVVYFSVPETDDPNDMTQEEANSTVVIDDAVLGNTQYMAYVIQETAGADIYRIEPETPYPTDHETLVDQALDEQDRGYRPAIKDTVENMDDYEVIYLGYPNWWGDMPMILYSFLEQYDLTGKTIVPFNTHGGSGFSQTISVIAELQPNATVVQDGLTISRDHIQDAEQEIIDWTQKVMEEVPAN